MGVDITFDVELQLGVVLAQPLAQLLVLHELLEGVGNQTQVALVLAVLHKEVVDADCHPDQHPGIRKWHQQQQ